MSIFCIPDLSVSVSGSKRMSIFIFMFMDMDTDTDVGHGVDTDMNMDNVIRSELGICFFSLCVPGHSWAELCTCTFALFFWP
jgi:hypothetical protein